MGIRSRIRGAWNALRNKDPTPHFDFGPGYSYRPDRGRRGHSSERTIVAAIFNRIAMDAASVGIRHVQLDDEGRYLKNIDSTLDRCLNLEANIDQSGRAFIQDVVYSMLDEGVVAIVPVDVDARVGGLRSMQEFDGRNILTLRTGRILEWMPAHVRVQVYNDRSGKREEVVLPKAMVAIVENPFYAVMNDRNSTVHRLIRKMSLLDSVDEQTSSGKLDLLVGLPYRINSQLRRAQADERRRDIEQQLTGSKYGIAYVDATEKVTQLNRPLENNLLKQIEYLTQLAFSQLGITQEILNGTADGKTMQNYFSRIIEPALSTIVIEMKRKYLPQSAIDSGESIEFYHDPFKLVPVAEIAEIADKMTRNEIMTSNEIRQKIGMKPSDDPNADALMNKNLTEPHSAQMPEEYGGMGSADMDEDAQEGPIGDIVLD